MHNFVPLDDDSPPPSGTGSRQTSNPEHTAAIKRWTSEFLRLPPDAVITVNESACRDPGCPLVETTVAVFDAPGRTRRWRFTRPNVAVTKMMVQQTLATPPQS